MRCEPADTIIAKLGGLTEVAQAAGVTLTTVQRWRMPARKGGTGGFIPRKHHEALARLAKDRGFDLAPTAFLDADTAKEQLGHSGEAA